MSEIQQTDILFIDDVARMLKTSRATIERRLKEGTFPIPTLPGHIDKRPRWTRQVVERYLTSALQG
jgi:predicted DNA-binding transcriptional regulator AlpA